eukprot:COSAG05_NODE_2009_length_3706_cov_2.105905_5_plen_69_part_01
MLGEPQTMRHVRNEYVGYFQSYAHDSWLTIASKAGKPTGKLRAKISWRPKVTTPPHFCHHISVQAHGL